MPSPPARSRQRARRPNPLPNAPENEMYIALNVKIEYILHSSPATDACDPEEGVLHGGVGASTCAGDHRSLLHRPVRRAVRRAARVPGLVRTVPRLQPHTSHGLRGQARLSVRPPLAGGRCPLSPLPPPPPP